MSRTVSTMRTNVRRARSQGVAALRGQAEVRLIATGVARWEARVSERWTLHHADCLDVLRAMPDKSVDHVITDPPYDARTHRGARTGAGSPGGVSFLHLSDERELVSELLRVSNRWVIAFCTIEQVGSYQCAAGESWIRAGVWDRVNPSPQLTGDRPAQAVDAIAIMHRRGKKRWNRRGGAAIWRYSVHDGNARPDHPTPKPIALMTSLVSDFTDPGETILDPFAGSGTTGVAALRLGRKFIGIEKDAAYAQLARDRLSAEEQGSTLTAARAGQLAMFAKKVGGT